MPMADTTPTVDPKVAAWRGAGAHLPDFMRDFHDQKDLFKTIGPMETPLGREVDWMTAHCYAVDRFLWFMARHGYTLQKSRARLPFSDINETIATATAARRAAEADVLKSMLRRSDPHGG